MDKFAGVGLTNILVIWLLCTFFTLVAKTLVVKYPVPEGMKDAILAA